MSGRATVGGVGLRRLSPTYASTLLAIGRNPEGALPVMGTGRAAGGAGYACRPGLGVHRAIAQVQANLRRFPWFAKVDVDGYFPSIDHACLKRLLARRFKGADFLALLGRIIDSCPAAPGRGLPIGSLSSQHFANHYLDGADRFLLDHPLVCAHVRYMDDTLWWGQDRESVRQVLADFRVWLADERRLRLKATFQVNRSERGVTWCGARVLRGALRLTPSKQRRYRHGYRQWEDAWLAGDIDGLALQRVRRGIRGDTAHRQCPLAKTPPRTAPFGL